MAESFSTVILEKFADKKIATITLNRPEKRNAINQQMVDDMLAALEDIRADTAISVVVTKGNGPSYCSGLDLYYLRALTKAPPGDWDRHSPTRMLFDAVRNFPKVTIAQIHGYCLGGGLALMNSHDLVIAASNAQIGMPEILRGSFGQMATSTLFHSGISMKKAALIQLTGRNLTGIEADRIGLVSMAVEESELEPVTRRLAEEIAARHPAALASAKIAVQMGANLPLAEAMKMDQLVGAWQHRMVDPLAYVEDYLHSQKGGPKAGYRRPDV
ncbi:MAG TPA: enoyl-CoA hydratase/isomerase family protein [Candidatus Acidoferrales bacterium]|nr:enoyl-CoA hydratase/isomerase family protein [Candidatus Acidoferrales bacterium]